MQPHAWRFLSLLLVFLGLAAPLAGQAPQGDKEPLLQLEPGGPTALVTALCFSPDGSKLYAAGYDKVVRVWERQANGQYALLREVNYRVPIGPGINGAINAIAVSPDGNWLAVGGLGMIREGAGFREMGWIWPATSMSTEMWQDRGAIFVFHTRQSMVRSLRGHAGPVTALCFVPGTDKQPLRLVSVARERNPEQDKYVGGVRVWEVGTEQQLAKRTDLPDPAGVLPGLSVASTGARPNDLQVALVWQDQQLRLWDVASNQMTQVGDGEFNNIVQHPAPGLIVTGSFNRETSSGQLTFWKMNDLGQPEVRNRVAFAPVPDGTGGFTFTYPRVLALLPERAAVLARRVTVRNREITSQDYALLLVDLRQEQFGTILRQSVLWSGSGQFPAIAASGDHKKLAVAGHPDHGIRVLDVAQLLAGLAPPQLLTSSGTRWGSVSFAKQGAERKPGLLLGAEAGQAGGVPRPQGTLLFDFAHRTLLEAPAGSEPDTPDVRGWVMETFAIVDPGAGGASQLTIKLQRNGETIGNIQLKRRETSTALALLPTPASGVLKIPVVAVAYLDATGQPLLSLFHGQTGEELRRLTAHQGPIRHLAFSADGKFLASAGDDQTICVWSVSDLDQILGKFGQLAGIGVRAENEQLVIGRMDNPKMEGLRVGDIVEGLVQNKQLQRLGSARDFYDALLLTAPGQTTTLRVRQPNAQPRDLPLPVTQAVDERKPLFSLFITNAATPAEREWIGWSPHGHYEAKDQQAERLLVWHFNTGQSDKPTTSAEVKDPALRQQFLKPRLLEHLMATGSLTDALEKYRKPVAAPNFSLVLEEETEQISDQTGPLTVRQPRVNLKVTVAEPALAELASITWQMDQQPLRTVDLSRLTGPEFTVPLDLSPRQVHQVRVTATTKEQQPQTVRREIALRHVPPRPILRSALLERQTVQDVQFPLRATIRAGSPGQAVRFMLQHGHQGRPDAALTRRVQTEEQFAETLKLEPGENVIRLRAENADATDATRALEGETRTYLVVLAPKKNDVPPQISLELVNEATGAKQPVARDAVLTVRQPAMLLQGKVAASNQENLAKTELLLGEKNLLAAEEAKAERTIQQTLALQPGPNKLLLTAKSDTSPEAALPFTVVYQPALPGVEVASPRPDEVLLDASQTKLTANLLWSGDPQACEAVVQVNQETPQVIALTPGQAKLEVPIGLQPRANRLHIQLRNRWGAAVSLEPLFVSSLRPPRGLTVTPPEEGRSLVTLAARVQSPTELPLRPEFVTARINGHALPPESFSVRQLAGQPTWLISIRDVPLQEGQQNNFELHVRNEEAGLKEPVQVKLTGPKPQGLPPVIEFVQPATDTRVAEPTMKVQFRVRSQSSLQRLALLAGDERFELKDLERSGENLYTRQVKLKAGENLLRVEALNGIGLQTAKLTVNYVALPVRVVLTEPVPASMTEGQITLPEAEGGAVTLRGQVVWPVPPQQLPADARVKVYVNGFLQPPAQLAATTDPRRFEFMTQAYLNQKENRIEMEIPGVAQERQRRQVILVNSAKPERIRTRLVIVSVGLNDSLPAEALQQRAVKLFQDQQHWPFVLAEPPVIVTGTGATNGNVLRALVTMKSKIQRSAAAGSPRDIVVVYYAGHEVIDPQMGHFLLTASSRTDPRVDRSGISLQFLEDLLGGTYGARMLLLDVLRPESKDKQLSVLDRVASWSDASSVAVARASQSATGPTADDFRLLSAWNDVLPKAERFRDVEEAVQGKLQPMSNGTSTIRQHLRPLAEVKLKGL